MTHSLHVARGGRSLCRFLKAQLFDLRHTDLPDFKDWLLERLPHWQRDPVFALRSAIRDVRQAHPQLFELERAYRKAQRDDADSAPFERLQQIDLDLTGAEKAIAGLSAASKKSRGKKRSELQEKLRDFQKRHDRLQQEREQLQQASAERQALLQAEEALHAYRRAIGLVQQETRLEELLTQRGRRSGQSGESFEEVAVHISREYILSDFVRRPSIVTKHQAAKNSCVQTFSSLKYSYLSPHGYDRKQRMFAAQNRFATFRSPGERKTQSAYNAPTR